jgi:hypothetical protein
MLEAAASDGWQYKAEDFKLAKEEGGSSGYVIDIATCVFRRLFNIEQK